MRFQQTHNQGFSQLFLSVSWDLRVKHGVLVTLQFQKQRKRRVQGPRRRRGSFWEEWKKIVFPRQGVIDLPSSRINEKIELVSRPGYPYQETRFKIKRCKNMSAGQRNYAIFKNLEFHVSVLLKKLQRVWHFHSESIARYLTLSPLKYDQKNLIWNITAQYQT